MLPLFTWVEAMLSRFRTHKKECDMIGFFPGQRNASDQSKYSINKIKSIIHNTKYTCNSVLFNRFAAATVLLSSTFKDTEAAVFPRWGGGPGGCVTVYCFVNPCTYTTCGSGQRCVANYCGGCNADCV